MSSPKEDPPQDHTTDSPNENQTPSQDNGARDKDTHMDEASEGETRSVSSSTQSSNTSHGSDSDRKSRKALKKAHRKSRKDKYQGKDKQSNGKDPKKAARETIKHYQAKLDKLMIQYHEAIPTATTDRLKDYQKDIASTKKTLPEFRATLEDIYGDHESGNTTSNGETINKGADRMTAKDVPFFSMERINSQGHQEDHLLHRGPFFE